MEVSKTLNLFVCHKGVERSPSATRAFKDLDIPAEYFKGGTLRMKGLSLEEIKIEIPPQALIHLFKDPSDGPVSLEAQDISLAKLKEIEDELKLTTQIISVASLRAFLYGKGVDPDEYHL